jgi:adenylate/guanylate cyclase family protein
VKSFAHWSIRYKLLALLLLLGIMTFAATGTIAYLKNLHTVRQNVTNQLTGIRRSKASEIEAYYETIHSHVLTLSEDRMFIEATKEFRSSYQKLDAKPIPPETLKAVADDYRSRFYPEMQALNLARPRVEDYLPFTPAALQLQYEYIVKNPYPPLESTGVPGAIQITESVYRELGGEYKFEERGLIEVKGKGKLPAWILREEEVPTEASVPVKV